MKNLQTHFSSGELSPAFHGRVDAQGFSSGLALCRNFFVLGEGGAANRAGTRFVAPAKYADRLCRLLPFSLPSGWAVLEVGHLYLRVFVDGAPLLNPELSIEEISRANPAVAVCEDAPLVAGMHVFVESAPGMEELLGRYLLVGEVDSWSFSLPEIDSSRWGHFAGPGSVRPVFELATPYSSEEVAALSFVQHGSALYLAHPDHPPRKLTFTADSAWVLSEIDFTPRPAPPATVTLTPQTPGSARYDYGVSVVVGGFTGREESFVKEATLLTGPALLSTSASVTVAWSFGEVPAEVLGFKVYRSVDGILKLVRECGPFESSVKDDGSVQELKEAGFDALYDTAQFSGPGRYPGAVGLFEQRLWWGGSKEAPHRLWASRTGDFENMSARDPLQADDPLTFQLASSRVNPIRHLVSLKNLLILTSGAEFALVGGEAGVTATSARLVAEGYRGASQVPPLVIGDRLLFVEEKGSTVRELFKAQSSDGWFGGDLSFPARHLFSGRKVVCWCHASHPNGLVWLAMDDGSLLTLTFLSEYGVTAWARHDSVGGAFEAVCAVGGDEGEEELFFVVAREIDGKTARFVERLARRSASDPVEGFFVDCGATGRGEGLNSLGGLHHLEGMSVAVVADGHPIGQRVVEGGRVNLPRPASVVHAGLPITADLATLPLSLEVAGVGRRKRVGRVTLRLEGVGGIKAGPSFEELVELKSPVPGTARPLESREVELSVGGGWSGEARVCLRQSHPLAVTVQAVLPEVNLGA